MIRITCNIRRVTVFNVTLFRGFINYDFIIYYKFQQFLYKLNQTKPWMGLRDIVGAPKCPKYFAPFHL